MKLWCVNFPALIFKLKLAHKRLCQNYQLLLDQTYIHAMIIEICSGAATVSTITPQNQDSLIYTDPFKTLLIITNLLGHVSLKAFDLAETHFIDSYSRMPFRTYSDCIHKYTKSRKLFRYLPGTNY